MRPQMPAHPQLTDSRKAVKPIPLPDIIARYAAGESAQTLAQESHVNRGTIYDWMLGDEGEGQYRRLVRKCMTNRIAQADYELATAPDMHNIVRAREMAKFTRWDFERRFPALYGLKTGLMIDSHISVTVARTNKPVRARKPVRTPSRRQKAVDITSQVRPTPTGSEKAHAVNTLQAPTDSACTDMKAPDGTTT
jgi:hypothetical protein